MYEETPLFFRVDDRFITWHFFPVASPVFRHKAGGYLERQKLSFEQDEDNSKCHSSNHCFAQLLLAHSSRDSLQGLLDLKSDQSSTGKRWPKPSCLLL